MRRGLLSLSKDAVERSRQVTYPANAPQRFSSNAPQNNGGFQPPQPEASSPAQQGPPANDLQMPARPQIPRGIASGFLREAMASHNAMAARARMGVEGEENRSILSPAPAPERQQQVLPESALGYVHTAGVPERKKAASEQDAQGGQE